MNSVILHGRRLVQLQKWCHLGVKVNPFQNYLSFSSVTDLSSRDGGRKEETFRVSYLVDSLGLTPKFPKSISSKEKGNVDSVLNLLRSHGFTDSQISSIVKIYPRLLLLDAEKSIGPKLQFLQSRGDSNSDEFTEILSKVPKILGMRVGKTISVYYDFVKEIIEADKSDTKLCHSLPEGSQQGNKMRNLLVLRDLGVPQRLLFSLLISSYSSVCGKERFEESLKKVVEIGFDPTTPNFVKALQVIYGRSDKTIEERVKVYISLGFDVGDVWEMFKKDQVFLTISEKSILNFLEILIGLGFTKDEFVMMASCFPPLLRCSVESVKTKTDFLVEKMKWTRKAVTMRPQVYGYSMEKRLKPRSYIIQALRTRGLLGSEMPPISSVFSCTDQCFLNRYVVKHDVNKQLVAELMAIFTEHRAS